ncbi:MAG TPA: UDP-N-acetylglucosamine 1-carboxyvinyltransferase [Planctomycetes bacterium]|nr:UDP-N-acetylglucosamine 1-carboxyvinyltransferase [Planctomycetota bacterium]HIN79561.1 UDP-N-acetylglucosamine 1-carboxyvinyltransferase [Planctomycetota bacterium]
MDKLIIRGGRSLHGTVNVSGSKNGSLPILYASLLADGPVRLRGVPVDLIDIRSTLRLLEEIGMRTFVEGSEVVIEPGDSRQSMATYDLVRKMRASVYCLGPLLARHGHARVSMPGGCAIGIRPIDLHLKGIQALGADVEVRNGYIEARAQGDRLCGGHVYLSGPFGPTVGGTINTMMAASLATGETIIEGAACEPEVAGLARFLREMGVSIEGEGTPTISIMGVDRISGGEFDVPPDRIEAGTYLIAGAIAGGEVEVKGCLPAELRALIDILERMNVRLEVGENSIRVWGQSRLVPIDTATLPYPGLPTDLQAQLMALMCRAEGLSLISEKIYPDRFMHIAELNRLGARIRKEGPIAIIEGGASLSGADVMASDLRASASLVLAGLVAEGQTEVHRIYHLDRGYEHMEKKLCSLGADVVRTHDEDGV